MIPSIGFGALIIAMGVTLAQVFTPLCKDKKISPALISAGIFSLMVISFGSLLYCHAVSDFSVLNVFQHSNTHKPFIYKISGTWGNHEGSMLLLALILSAYNFAFAAFSRIDDKYKNIIISVQSIIALGFVAFISFTSNPFVRLNPVPQDGVGLNPLLQDIGLAMHPPVLYMGYIGFSVGFAYAVAALIAGQADKEWASSLKRWTLFSWSFLTLGIGLGSWWAYRELGWGGFWFWDPVENASLMPWLAGTAFLHSLVVMEKRGVLKVWTVLLGVLTFSLSLVGIFLVRSGVITSVHSFASDPERGVYILAFLLLVIAGSLTLFAARGHKLKPENDFVPFSKEGGILLNNLLLVVLCLTVLLGTIYPILMEVFTKYRVAVGAPYYNEVFHPLALPLLILAGIVPAVNWKKDNFKSLKAHLFIPIAATVFVAGFVAFVPDTKSVLAIASLSFSAWLISSMLAAVYQRRGSSMPRAFIAMVISHIGVGVLVAGVTVVSVWGTEVEKIINMNESVKTAGYDIKMTEMFIGAQDNYLNRFGTFEVRDYKGRELGVLHPEVRYYPVEDTNTTESAIYYGPLSNIYVAMGDSAKDGGFVVRVYYKPWINLIWLGCVLMALGGFVALSRRLD